LTKDKNEPSSKKERHEPSWLDRLFAGMFLTALPVWRRHGGAVPVRTLKRLEAEGDWPRGIAAALMKRLTKDEDFRQRLGQLARERRKRRETDQV
jgi:hypothetical protein